MKYKVRGVVCLAFAAGLALVVRAEGEAPSTSTLAQNEEVLSTYTRQLKLAELREARINIRQDRVCPPHLLGEVKIGRQKEAWRFLFSYT